MKNLVKIEKEQLLLTISSELRKCYVLENAEHFLKDKTSAEVLKEKAVLLATEVFEKFNSEYLFAVSEIFKIARQNLSHSKVNKIKIPSASDLTRAKNSGAYQDFLSLNKSQKSTVERIEYEIKAKSELDLHKERLWQKVALMRSCEKVGNPKLLEKLKSEANEISLKIKDLVSKDEYERILREVELNIPKVEL